MKNETSAVATEVCKLRLEVWVLGTEQDVSAGLCRALGTCKCDYDQEGRRPSAWEKQYRGAA